MTDYYEGSAPYAAALHIQEMLNSFGAHLATDGNFGPKTKAAVIAFQWANSLTADGIVGPITLAALKNPASKPISYAPPTPTGGRLPISTSQVTYGLQPYGWVAYSQWAAWRNQAMAICGVSGSDWQSGLDIIEVGESGGQVNAVNTTDLNAVGPIVSDGHPEQCSRGLMQVIYTTFANNHAQGTSNDIYEPIANITSAVYYILGRYGSIDNVPGVRSVRNGGGYQGY